jgi:hypothetical protein
VTAARQATADFRMLTSFDCANSINGLAIFIESSKLLFFWALELFKSKKYTYISIFSNSFNGSNANRMLGGAQK